jgi:hypothetical protein
MLADVITQYAASARKNPATFAIATIDRRATFGYLPAPARKSISGT